MARYLVTGATGFVGAEVAKQLRTAGHTVLALVRSPEKAALLKAMRIELHAGDITDRESLRGPMSGVDGVFHCAAWYKIGVPGAAELAYRTNVVGTRNVLETMRELGVPKGVYTSTVAVFSDTRGREPDESYRYDGAHLSTYDRTKWQAHHEVALPMIAEGLPLVIVQPGAVYGPGDTSALRAIWVDLLHGRLRVVPGRTAFCWGYIDDTARGHLLAMEKGRIGESYIITGPRHTLAEAVTLAARLSQAPRPLLRLPPFTLRGASLLMRLVNPFVTLPPTISPEGLRVLAGVTYLGDASKARTELGFAARPLAEGLQQTIEHEQRVLGLPPTI
jgi:nucleoside-diphosphate-sugar epimerase